MSMTKLQKVMAIMIMTSTLISGVYWAAGEVQDAVAFMEKTDRRHTQEDLLQLWRVRDAMVQRRNARLPWSPADENNLLILNQQVLELETELGYINKETR